MPAGLFERLVLKSIGYLLHVLGLRSSRGYYNLHTECKRKKLRGTERTKCLRIRSRAEAAHCRSKSLKCSRGTRVSSYFLMLFAS